MKVALSIIILNYNTKKITLDLIKSIEKNYIKETVSGEYEVIVADNGSPDNSIADLLEYKKKTKIKTFYVCDNKNNLGFAKGNNNVIKLSNGRYILFLNPDTIVPPKTLTFMLNFMDNKPYAGAATCKIIQSDGRLDRNCIRGFPTPWNAFCYFLGISKIFPESRLFSGYIQSSWRDMNCVQEVDAIEGAFMLVPREIGEKVGWLDEDYFFYGEDLQFCLDIHNAGYKIYYVPEVNIIHYGGASSGIKEQSEKITTANLETKKKVQNYRFNAMRIFFQKNYVNKYPKIIGWLVNKGIDFLYNKNLEKLSSIKS
jgi:GT2 family glycosyltransferase